MTEIFRHRDSALVGHLQKLLQSEGIETFFRNEHVSATAFPLAEFTPALCVVDDADVDRGLAIARTYLEAGRNEVSADIVCPNCREPSPGNFAECWSCGAPLG